MANKKDVSMKDPERTDDGFVNIELEIPPEQYAVVSVIAQRWGCSIQTAFERLMDLSVATEKKRDRKAVNRRVETRRRR